MFIWDYPKVKYLGQINLIYHTVQRNMFHASYKLGRKTDFHSCLIDQANLTVLSYNVLISNVAVMKESKILNFNLGLLILK